MTLGEILLLIMGVICLEAAAMGLGMVILVIFSEWARGGKH